jgi:hypothetical protein
LQQAQLVFGPVARRHDTGRGAGPQARDFRWEGLEAGPGHLGCRQMSEEDDLAGELRLQRIDRVERGDLPGGLLLA